MTKGPDFRPRPSPTGGRNWIWTSGPLRVNPSPFVLLRPRPTQNVMVDAIGQRPGTLRHVIDRNRDGSMFVLRLLLCFQGAPYTSSPLGTAGRTAVAHLRHEVSPRRGAKASHRCGASGARACRPARNREPTDDEPHAQEDLVRDDRKCQRHHHRRADVHHVRHHDADYA